MADDTQDTPSPEREGIKSKTAGQQGADQVSSKSTDTGPSATTGNASTDKDAGAAPKSEGPGAKTAGPGTSGPEASSQQPGNASSAASDKGDHSSIRTFEVFENALKNTDWAWKIKSGNDRELGLNTFVHAQKAWVAAAAEDPKRASQMWRAKTKRNPTAEMEQMLSDRLKSNNAPGAGAEKDEKSAKVGNKGKGSNSEEIDNIETLSNDIAETAMRRELSDSKTRKISLSSTLGDWNVMRGDAQSRERGEKRKRTDELLSPEPDKNQDGLHLAKSLYKGFMSHRESAQGAIEANRRSMVTKVVAGIEKEIGKVSTKISNFETELNVPEDERDTLGIVGNSLQRVESQRTFGLGSKVAKILVKQTKSVASKTVAESKKKFGQVADASRKLAEGAAIQGAALTANPGKIDSNANVAGFHARMEQFNRFQRNNMGPGQ